MGVQVTQGGLSVSLTADTSGFSDDIVKSIKKASEEVEKLQGDLLKAATAGNRSFEKMFNNALKLSEDIAPLIEKGLAGVDSASLQKLNNQVANANNEFEALQKTIDFIEQNLNSFSLNPDELEQLRSAITQIKSAFDGLNEKQKSTFSQIRSLKDELSKQSNTGSVFGDTLKEAAALQEKIKSVQTELKLAGSNAPGIMATGQAVRGLVAGFQALQGTIALLSGDNEDLDKTVKSLVASMSVLQGISEVMQVLDKNSALNVFLTAQSRNAAAIATTEQVVATEALAVAESTQATATEGALVAQEGLNTAMKANPAALLLAGLTAVVAAIQFFSKETKDATEDTKRFNQQISRIGEDANKIIDQINFLTEFNSEIARTRGAIESEITRENIKGYLTEAGAYQGAIDRKILATKKFFQQYVDVSEISINNLEEAESALRRIQDVMTASGFDKLSEDFRRNIEAAEGIAKSVVSDFKTITNLEQKTQIENQRLIAQTFQESLRSAQASAEASLLLSKKNTKEELELRIAAINRTAEADLNAGNLTTGERRKILAQQQKDIRDAQQEFRILQLNDQKALIQSQLNAAKEGSAQELRLKIDLINQTAVIELAQAGLTQARITEIKSNAAKQIADLTKKFNQDVLEADIQSSISTTKAKISATIEGTKEEFDLRTDLIDQQAQLQIAQAKDQLKDESLLQTKITEILAESLLNRKKLQENYIRDVLAKQFESLDRQTDKLNDPLQAVLSNPKSNVNDKYAAQLRINQNELDKMREKQRLLAIQIETGTGDVKEMIKAYEDLSRAISKLSTENDNQKLEKFGKDIKKIAADILSISSSIGELGKSLEGTNDGLSDTLQTLSEIGNIAGNAASAVGQFAMGDIPGGIASTVKAIGGIFNIGKAARESRRQALADIDEFYERIKAGELELTQIYRDRERDIILLNKLRVEGLQAEKKLLQEQKSLVVDQYNTILAQLQAESFVADKVTKKYGGFLGIGRKTKSVEVFESLAGRSFEDLEKLFTEGRLEGKAKELFEQLQKIKNEGVDIDRMLEENKLQVQELFTGTTADSIIDSIAEGFESGERSASDFADNFQDLMRKAVIQSLKFKFLEGPLNKLFEDFAAASESDGQLTNAEIDRLQSLYNSIIENASDQFDQLQQIAGINFNSPGSSKTLTGAIKGITEQQAELLAGQFGAQRLTLIEQLKIATQGIKVLQNIETNTFRLHEVRDILRRLEFDGIKIK